MVRVKGEHWTADFTIARALAEAYESSGKDDIVYLCVGDPDTLLDALGPQVAKELRPYYPHILGTPEEPIRVEDLPKVVHILRREWPNAFVIGIEAVSGAPEDVGYIEVTDRGIRRRPTEGDEIPWVGDVSVSAALWTGTPPNRITPDEYNRFLRVTSAVVDGQIRFLQRVKKYQPEL